MSMYKYLLYEYLGEIFHSALGKTSKFIRFLINLPQLESVLIILTGHTNETYY